MTDDTKKRIFCPTLAEERLRPGLNRFGAFVFEVQTPDMAALMARLRVPQGRLSAPPARLTAPPKAVDLFYQSKAWLTLVAAIKRERGAVCEDCYAEGVVLIGDHVRELKDGGAPLDKANVRLLCRPCHNTKTAVMRARRARSRR